MHEIFLILVEDLKKLGHLKPDKKVFLNHDVPAFVLGKDYISGECLPQEDSDFIPIKEKNGAFEIRITTGTKFDTSELEEVIIHELLHACYPWNKEEDILEYSQKIDSLTKETLEIIR